MFVSSVDEQKDEEINSIHEYDVLSKSYNILLALFLSQKIIILRTNRRSRYAHMFHSKVLEKEDGGSYNKYDINKCIYIWWSDISEHYQRIICQAFSNGSHVDQNSDIFAIRYQKKHRTKYSDVRNASSECRRLFSNRLLSNFKGMPSMIHRNEK